MSIAMKPGKPSGDPAGPIRTAALRLFRRDPPHSGQGPATMKVESRAWKPSLCGVAEALLDVGDDAGEGHRARLAHAPQLE